MEAFKISLAGETLTVTPKEDGSFTITKGGEHVAELCPDITKEQGTRWHPCNGINDDLAEQIGELIEEHEI